MTANRDERDGGHLLTRPRGSYSSLPFANPSTRPATPTDTQFAFSTTLRRSSIGHDDARPNIPSSLRQQASSAAASAAAGLGYSHGKDDRNRDHLLAASSTSPFPNGGASYDNPLNGTATGHAPHHLHAHHPFAHTTGVTTPSARFARCSVIESASQLQTDLDTGLSNKVVAAIREISGPNEFTVESQEKALSKFLKQFYESPLILLLLGSSCVSALVGNFDDAISITLAIIIVVTVGFVQEQRSEKSLEALNKLVPHYCHVIRDGTRQNTLANVLVPGDIVYFSVGDRIPADIRLIRSVDLEIDESNLTGETKPARKGTEALEGFGMGHDPGISERTNTAFMGTLVRNGHGSGIVVATGSQSEFGVIFSMMQEVGERKTPLQLSMDELAKKLSAISFAVIGVICLIGVYQQRSWLEMFTIGGKGVFAKPHTQAERAMLQYHWLSRRFRKACQSS